MNILIIEDNPDDYEILQVYLEEQDDPSLYKNHWSVTLEDGLLYCRNADVDITLLDLTLPDSSGLETFQKFHLANPDNPVIILTGYQDDRVAQSCVEMGAQDFLFKDRLNSEVLVKSMQYALYRFRILQDLEGIVLERTASLAESENRYRSLVDSFPGGAVFLVSQSLDVIVSGGDILDKIGKKGSRLETSINNQELLTISEKTILDTMNGIKHSREFLLDKCYYDISGYPISHSEEDPSRRETMLMIRDITAMKKSEEQLLRTYVRELELSETRAKLMTMISHELRTPLTTLYAAVHILRDYDDRLDRQQKRKQQDKIIAAASTLKNILDDALFLADIKGNFTPRPESLNIFSLIETHALNIRSQFPGYRLDIEPFPEACFSYLDRDLLRMIISPVMDNAFRYSLPTEIVTLHATRTDTELSVFVSDQGIGIPPDDMGRILSPFQRGSNIKNIPGVGLGLAVASASMALLGGKIEIFPGIEQGCTVALHFPITDDPRLFSD